MKALAKYVYRRLPLKRQALELLRPFRLPPRLYRHLYFEGPFTIELPDGSFRMWSYGDQIENELFWTGFSGVWERTSLEAWRRLAQQAKSTILDIGANTGTYALVARAVNPTSPIAAFEPLRRVADKAAANVRLNGFNIVVDARAVSDHTGTAVIFDMPGDNAYSASLQTAFPESDRSYEVPTVALDEADIARPVSLLKLDVELHEPAAVRGMLDIFRRDRPAMLVEILTPEVGRDVAQLLSGLDYRFFQIDEEAGLIETKELAPMKQHHWNNLVCTDEQFSRGRLEELCVSTAAP